MKLLAYVGTSLLVLLLLSTTNLIGQSKIVLDSPVGSTATTFRVGDVQFSSLYQTIEVVLYEADSDGEFVDGGSRVDCIWTEADGATAKTNTLWGEAMTEAIIIDLAQDHNCLGSGTVSAID